MSVLWQRPLKDGGTCLLSNHFFPGGPGSTVRFNGRLRFPSLSLMISQKRERERERKKDGHSLNHLHSSSSSSIVYFTLHYILSLFSLSSLTPFSPWGDCHHVGLGRVDYKNRRKPHSIVFLSLDFLEESSETAIGLEKSSTFSFCGL